MGDPIIITVDAQTGLATVKLDKFLQEAVSKVNAANLAAAGAAANGAAGVGKAAAEASTHIAGLSYYARSAADSIRLAFAGGGARAGFYAIDEAVRGLLASGLGLSTLLPIIGVLVAAVGGGVLVWREWTSAEREAAKATEELHKSLKGTADLMVQMQEMAKAGLLSPEAFQKNVDLLTGKTKLYKTPTGEITSQPTSEVETQPTAFTGSSYYVPPSIPGGTRTVANQQLTGTDLTKYVQDQLAVPGGLDQEEAKAKDKLLELRGEIHAKTVSDTELEINKIHEKYEAERAEIVATAAIEGKLLTDPEKERNKKAIDESVANESVEINAKRQEQIDKINEAASAAHVAFAKSANERLDADLTASAARQGRTREQIFEEEYERRMWLLSVLKTLSIVNEEQYTQAVAEAQAKRLEGETREANEIKAIRNKLALAGTSDLKKQELEINERYDLEIEKVKKLNLSLADQLKLIEQINAARKADLGKAATDAADEAILNQHKYQSIAMMFKQMLGVKENLSEKEKEAEDRIDAEREQAVNTMFTNIGQAAKVFGAQGLAVYKGIAIAQATVDTAKAAIGAYSSVAGIPYVGWILAPVAAAAAVAAGAVQIAQIESASARERGGPVTAGSLYMTGERGRELYMPESDGYIFNATDTSRIMDSVRSGSSPRSSSSSSNQHISVNLFHDMEAINKHARDNPEFKHIVVDIMRGNAHYLT